MKPKRRVSIMGPTTEMHTLPVFDENGIQIGFQQVNRLISQTQPTGSLVKSQPNIHPSQPASDPLQPNFKNWTSISSIDLSNPAALTTFIPLDPQPLLVSLQPYLVIYKVVNGILGQMVNIDWILLTLSIWLLSGWQFNGLPKVTLLGAETPLLDLQLLQLYFITWGQQDGDISTTQYRYINGTAHTHSRLPGVVRTTAAEDQRFRTIYENRPNATSTQLMVGAPAPQGFGPSAADLGQKFSQKAYTSYQLNQEKKKDRNDPTSVFGNLQNLQK
ncbi:hypothetical protein F5876DRAFT_66857 [Lentinula aff. lateritia]|uniref:Uncharacterized protein n=1 Tax=Lentinula aff. lateritia TaxID=2804960 RepID=A0ACC1TWJ8_9AGAR|nr:hypothetical protein F5876DRAFT_66857 [Lentinula aff. lateritia]